MSIADNKARYEGTAFQHLMEAAGHTICDRCYCCDATYQPYTCWRCGGCCGDWAEDDDDDGYCSVCESEGEISVLECLGRCDENGCHEKKPVAALGREKEGS